MGRAAVERDLGAAGEVEVRGTDSGGPRLGRRGPVDDGQHPVERLPDLPGGPVLDRVPGGPRGGGQVGGVGDGRHGGERGPEVDVLDRTGEEVTGDQPENQQNSPADHPTSRFWARCRSWSREPTARLTWLTKPGNHQADLADRAGQTG